MNAPGGPEPPGTGIWSSQKCAVGFVRVALFFLLLGVLAKPWQLTQITELRSGVFFVPSFDFVWFFLAALTFGLSRGVRRGWVHPVHAVGLVALALMAWACLGAMPWGAQPTPQWLGPRGLGPLRAWALTGLLRTWILTALLGAWVAAEWWGTFAGKRSPWTDVALVMVFAAVRSLPLTMSVELSWLIQEEGLFLANGLALLDGEHMYRDRWEFLWPGIFQLSGLVLGMFGRSLLAVRAVLTLVYALCAGLMYSCVRREAGRGAALIGVLLFLTAMAPHPVHWDPHWITTCTGLIATWCLVRKLPPTRFAAFGAGMAMGATIVFQQHKGFGLLVCLGGGFVALAAYVAWREGRTAAGAYARSIAWIGGGLAAVIGPVLFQIAARGDWAAFHYATWTWLFEGYGPANASPSTLLPAAYVLKGPPWAVLANLWFWGSETVAHSSGLALPLAFLIWLLPPPPGRSRRAWWILAAGCTGVFTATLLRYQYLRLVYASPAMCILLAAGIGRVWAYGFSTQRWARLVQSGMLLLLVTMAVHAWRAQLAYQWARPRWGLANTAVGPLLVTSFDQRRLQDTVASFEFLTRLPADAECYAYPLSGGYEVLTGRRNPTRFHFILPGYSRPWQVDEVIATLDARSVRFVLWDHNYSERFMRDVYPNMSPDAFDRNRITAYILKHYRPVREWPTITIFERVT